MVENGLHWVMDVTFRDDQYRIRTDHAPANFTTIKHMALNLIRRARGKDSLRLCRKVAAWDFPCVQRTIQELPDVAVVGLKIGALSLPHTPARGTAAVTAKIDAENIRRP
jgi:hypothetical protein